ncbi:MerR family transcriptional regulator [Vallitalea okinawensis]|uniref:MerR family transcriptional regulator n=1 Tax=Vallitalea okinawensis TaxID=2078660 RepID=UPI000CFC3A5A|nr:MerR family transcriptional regulator [Vallitalea okinawensis]
MNNRYRMGQVSNFIGISKDTIRHWQKKGLLETKKDDNNYNAFTDEDYFKIYKINFYRNLGFSISEIKELLKRDAIDDKKEIIDKHIKQINNEIEKLNYQRDVLKETYEMPTSREVNLQLIQRVFKLKKVDTPAPSNFSISKDMQGKQLFITNFDTETLEGYDVHIEVSENEDFVYSHDTFIHCFYPREKLVENSFFISLINRFAEENNLRLIGEIVEVHDLKQLFFNDFDFIEFYIAVKDYNDI